METTVKKRLRPVLLKMQVNDIEIYPVTEIASVRAVIHVIQLQKDMRFTAKVKDSQIIVARTA